ncbi:MAG TPA: aldo/keto reductase [Candidatus Solibacter sp.]|nr:aldo/keto reductase [Candidatus Solibacter sp.]
MSHTTRRDFLAATLGAAAFAGRAGAQTKKRLATDWVTLGKSNVKVTRLAFGTGTFGGRVQRELGQDGFTRLVRHAYDNGIRFFETADTYGGMHEMLGIALKGIPRDRYALMTKYRTPPPQGVDPAERLDLYRRQLNTEYFDIMLIHCVRPPTWDTDYQPLQDSFSEAKHKKVIVSHGASVHGLPALRKFPGNKWLDIAMIRMNHNGTRMDVDNAIEPRGEVKGVVDEVVQHTKAVHKQGMGVISMKLCGEGRFTNPEDREAALKFAMNLGCVDSVTIGFKSTAEIDEAIERMNRVMNA